MKLNYVKTIKINIKYQRSVKIITSADDNNHNNSNCIYGCDKGINLQYLR